MRVMGNDLIAVLNTVMAAAASALVSEWRDPVFVLYGAMAAGHLVVYHAILEV